MPDVELRVLNSESYANKKVSELYPDFRANYHFTNYSIEKIREMNLDLVFLAMPNGEAMKLVPRMNCKVIDLSADYRFNNKGLFERIYNIKHCDKKRNAVYGLPEIFNNKIRNANLIANPGCYATACILAVYPILEFSKYIVFDCKSGYSGAGKKQCYVNNPKNYTDNIIPYNIVNHRHRAEIEQFVNTRISFTPHVIPTFQGLMSTAHILLKKKITSDKIRGYYERSYYNKPFIKILDKIPDLHDVQKTNYCCIGGFEVDSNNQLVVISVIDNLLKGASGQAVQNMNLLFGLDERNGLM